MRRLAPLSFLLATAAAPAHAPDAAAAIAATRPDASLIGQGQLGIVIYALLSVIGLVLLRGFMADLMLGRALSRLGDGLAALNIQLSRLESTVMARDAHHDGD